MSNQNNPFLTGYIAADILYFHCSGIDDDDEYNIAVIVGMAQMVEHLAFDEQFTSDFYDGLRDYAFANPNFREALILSKIMTEEELDGLS
jgi:hypothetical protein